MYNKKYQYLWYIISIVEKIFKSSFLTNLFRDINVARIFYKLVKLTTRKPKTTIILESWSIS